MQLDSQHGLLADFVHYDYLADDEDIVLCNLKMKLYFLEKMISERILLKEITDISVNSLEIWIDNNPCLEAYK